MIAVLNFGSQFAHLIARRVRDLGVKAEIFSFDVPARDILALKPKGVILSGGPASVLEKNSPRPDKRIFDAGIPVLGICYGEQVMAKMLGGRVEKGRIREYGREILEIHKREDIFSGLDKREIVWFSHGDQVTKMPENFRTIASTKECVHSAIRHNDKPIFGIQFHPEVTHTKGGSKIFSNFVFKICKCKKNWNVNIFSDQILESLGEIDGHVLVGVSGGVDSMVLATILNKAIKNKVHAALVDTGFLRHSEAGEVSGVFKKQRFNDFHIIPAQNIFLRRLKGVSDPEQKRKIIGHTFIEIFEKFVKTGLKKYPVKYFAQGTIYPDRIESAEPSRHASKIKSHHNLTLPEKFGFEILEPLKNLYKDEVRKLGESLGLPGDLIWRHPFPGPGLAVRIVGEITKERLHILRQADRIYIEELKKSEEYEKIWQAFAVLLPLRTVGVMGDARTYDYIISLRAVDSTDGMSADWHKMPNELLERISNRIVGEVKGVNRVLYDITQKPPATIEYE